MEDIQPGEYLLSQWTGPGRDLMSASDMLVTIEPSKITEVDMVLINAPTLFVHSVDQDGNSLLDACYGINSSAHRQTYCDEDGDGYVTIKRLPPGSYQLVQEGTPKFYQRVEDQNVTIADTVDPVDYTVVHQAGGAILITTWDGEENAERSGSYRIYENIGGQRGDLVTWSGAQTWPGEGNRTRIDHLAPGNYLIHQNSVTGGLFTVTDDYPVTVAAGAEVPITITNTEPYPTLLIHSENQSGELLPGACYRSRYWQEGRSNVVFCDADDGENDGITTVPRAQPASYPNSGRVFSTVILEGYDPLADQHIDIPAEPGVVNVTFEHVAEEPVPQGSVLIATIDEETGTPIYPCYFVYDHSGAFEPVLIGSSCGREDGTEGVKVGGLAPGTYSLRQGTVGHLKVLPLTADTIFTIEGDEQVEISLSNKPRPTVIVQSQNLEGQLLSGACYRLRFPSSRNQRALEACDEDNDGIVEFHRVEPFPIGRSYQLYSPIGLTGYAYPEPIDVPVPESPELILVIVEHHVQGTLTINALDSETNTPVDRACYSIFRESDGGSGNELDIRDEYCLPRASGDSFTFDHLPAGDYFLQQVSVSGGLFASSELNPFTITAGQNTHIAIENQPWPTLHIESYDELDNLIEGACYGLLPSNYLSNRFACDADDGSVDGTTTVPRLQPRTYDLTETETPLGYARAVSGTLTVPGNPGEIVVRMEHLPGGSLVINRQGWGCYRIYEIDGSGDIGTEANRSGCTSRFGGLRPGTYLLRGYRSGSSGPAVPDTIFTILAGQDTVIWFGNPQDGPLPNFTLYAEPIVEVGEVLVVTLGGQNADGTTADLEGYTFAFDCGDSAGASNPGVDMGAFCTYTTSGEFTLTAEIHGPGGQVIQLQTLVTVTPADVPTEIPTAVPTAIPSEAPTVVPTNEPTAVSTEAPTIVATTMPTEEPTIAPTQDPTEVPTISPTEIPTIISTVEPTVLPTSEPTVAPTSVSTQEPTMVPTEAPTESPTLEPTAFSTEPPTEIPTTMPTETPPTAVPSEVATEVATEIPTVVPTDVPTQSPTQEPTEAPTKLPTQAPTLVPTGVPTSVPTIIPTELPTEAPTHVPTMVPTIAPTDVPTELPTAMPTDAPTMVPTEIATEASTEIPTQIPTVVPTDLPTQVPTEEPTTIPTEGPTAVPTEEPTFVPTELPTIMPSVAPTEIPTQVATELPTQAPTDTPTFSVILGLAVSEGVPGTTTELSGSGFAARETITITGPDGGVVTTVSGRGTGSFQTRVTIPTDAAAGTYTFTVAGETSGAVGTVAFQVVPPPPPVLSLSVGEGTPGTTTELSGSGFAARETITITGPDGDVVTTASGRGTGSFTTRVTIPAEVAAGAYTFTVAGETSGAVGTVDFLVTTPPPPVLSLSVSEGMAGTTELSGSGFAPRETITITGPDGEVVTTASGRGTGSFTTRVTIPADAAAGTYTYTVAGETSGAVGTVDYLVIQPSIENSMGTVVGTDGDGLRCRADADVDGRIITVLAEGEQVAIRGPVEGDWLPVICNHEDGFVAIQYVAVSETQDSGIAMADEPNITEVPIVMPATDPAQEQSIAATMASPTPLPLVGGWQSDPAAPWQHLTDASVNTAWSGVVTGDNSSIEVGLDLGTVQPVSHLRWMPTWPMLGEMDVRVSNDGVTWYRVTTLSLSGVEAEVWGEIPVHVQARYIAILITGPEGPGAVGGIAEMEVWPESSGSAAPIESLMLIVPTAEPTEIEAIPILPEPTGIPTDSPVPTPVEIPTEAPSPSVVPTEVPIETEPPPPPTEIIPPALPSEEPPEELGGG
jgi:methionine-rich copper-binding protein CopC